MRSIQVALLVAAALPAASFPVAEAAAQPMPGSGATPAEVLAVARRYESLIKELTLAAYQGRLDAAGVNARFGRQPIALFRGTVGGMKASLSAYPKTQEAHRAWVAAYREVSRILESGLFSVSFYVERTKGQPHSFYPEIARLRAELKAFHLDRAHYFAGGQENALRLVTQAPNALEAHRTAARLYYDISDSDWPAGLLDYVLGRRRTEAVARDAAKAARDERLREDEYSGVPMPLRRLFLERRLKNERVLYLIYSRQYSRVAEHNPFKTMGGTIFDPSGRSDTNRHVRQHLHALKQICPERALQIGFESMPDEDYFDLKGGRVTTYGLVTPSMEAAAADAQAFVSLMGCRFAVSWSRFLKDYLEWKGR